MTDAVKLSAVNGVVMISFNRPHVVNALDAEMMRNLRRTMDAVKRNTLVRAVV